MSSTDSVVSPSTASFASNSVALTCNTRERSLRVISSVTVTIWGLDLVWWPSTCTLPLYLHNSAENTPKDAIFQQIASERSLSVHCPALCSMSTICSCKCWQGTVYSLSCKCTRPLEIHCRTPWYRYKQCLQTYLECCGGLVLESLCTICFIKSIALSCCEDDALPPDHWS